LPGVCFFYTYVGVGSALIGKEAAMACTVAVESVIVEHYNKLVIYNILGMCVVTVYKVVAIVPVDNCIFKCLISL